MFAPGVIQVTPQDKEAIERVSLMCFISDIFLCITGNPLRRH
jgi:hypothetical protein